MSRALVVSIHDVAPVTQTAVAAMLVQLQERDVSHCSLLVVPDYHRTGSSFENPDFIAWLQELARQGHEVVIHGYHHQRERREGESVRQKAVTRLYTADEGEFYDLDYDEALRLIRLAQGEFTAQGLQPTGFIAPAWLLSAEAERAAIEAGIRYTTTLTAVRDFASGREHLSQSLVYSVRSDWRCAISLLWNRTLFRRLKRNPLLRVSLHPPDLAHPGIWRQITALIAKGRRDREVMTYRAWLDLPTETP